MYSYGHKIKQYAPVVFRIFWTVDYGAGSKKKPRTFSRRADDKGVQRFKKKWRLEKKIKEVKGC